MFPERVASARVAEPAAEAAVQAVYGAASWSLCGAVYGPEHRALGPEIQLSVPGVAVLHVL